MIERFQDLWLAEDHVTVHRALFHLSNDASLSVDEVLSLFELPSIWRDRFPAACDVRLASGEIIPRARFEDLIWPLGEALRQILKGKKERKDPRIVSAIARVCGERSYRKGRESFVMLFGDLQLRGQEVLLAELLDDPEMVGHAVFALRKLKATQPREKVARLIEHPKSWVRKEVRKYLEKTE